MHAAEGIRRLFHTTARWASGISSLSIMTATMVLDYLAKQPDALGLELLAKRAPASVDWLNWLQMKYAHGHWALTVSGLPLCDTRPLRR